MQTSSYIRLAMLASNISASESTSSLIHSSNSIRRLIMSSGQRRAMSSGSFCGAGFIAKPPTRNVSLA